MKFSDPDVIQLLSLPAEIIGLALVLVELYFPTIQAALNGDLITLGRKMIPSRLIAHFAEGAQTQSQKALKVGYAILVFVIMATLSGYIMWLVSQYIGWYGVMAIGGGILGICSVFFQDQWKLGLFLMAPLIGVYMIVLLLGLILHGLIRALRACGVGKPVAGLGFIFAIAGLVGEAYQVDAIEGTIVQDVAYWWLILGLVILLAVVGIVSSRRAQQMH